MIAAAEDAEALEAHTKAMQYEKMFMEQKLNQEQAAAKAQAKQLEFQKEKMKLELEHQKQISSLKENVSASISKGTSAMRIAKMPGLVISKFEGTPQDWVRFSGPFSSQIDSTSEPATKFSYLKELVDVKVWKLIDGLPFTEGGYLKAKALLEKRYGQTNEVVGAYVRNILSSLLNTHTWEEYTWTMMTESVGYQSTLFWEPTISPKFAPGNDCVLAAAEIL